MHGLVSAFFEVMVFVQANGFDVDIDVDPAVGLAGGALSTVMTTLIVGAILVVVVPAYTERMMGHLEDEPVGSFVYGVLALVVLIILTILLVVTILGILLAIPLVLLAVLVWAIGAVIGYLVIADRLIGHRDGWTKPLVLAAGINGALTLTGIGGLVAFCIGAAGFGTVLRDRFG